MATDKNKSTEPLNPKPSLDQLFRFTFDGVPVRGQWVRLGNCLDAANEHRSYDPATRIILGQMFTAAAMFADNLKFDGAVALQSSGDGRMVRSLAECRNQQFLRGVVHLDDDIQAPAPQASLRDWLGKSGRLAITLQPDSSTAHSENAPQSYQGLVALDHGDLKTALEHYFDVSEQLPTRIYFGGDGASMTGLLVQKLPHEANANDMQIAQADDAWETACAVADTVTIEELSNYGPSDLLRRLFAEFNVRLHPGRSLHYRCTCSRSKTDGTLMLLGAKDLQQLIDEQEVIEVNCELCGAQQRYDRVDIAALINQQTPSTPGSSPLH